jgi:hypothetical protein
MELSIPVTKKRLCVLQFEARKGKASIGEEEEFEDMKD